MNTIVERQCATVGPVEILRVRITEKHNVWYVYDALCTECDEHPATAMRTPSDCQEAAEQHWGTEHPYWC